MVGNIFSLARDTRLAMLGHATISQTMDIYSHVVPGMGDVAATALEEALS